MKTNTIDFTGDAMLVRAMDGAVTVSIPVLICATVAGSRWWCQRAFP